MGKMEVFLDVLLVEEIPAEDAQATGIVNSEGRQVVLAERYARKAMYGKVMACGDKFPMSGVWVDMPYKVGDVIKTNEFGRNYITFSTEDLLPGAKKYYLIRYADVEGRINAS